MNSLNNVTKFAKVDELRSDAMSALRTWDKLPLSDGAIPKKYKELMAIAVALTTKCPDCIEVHLHEAIKAGATEKELAEVIHVSAALRSAGTVTHGTHFFEG
ncbi:MAG: alkylhydroperoxidase [Blastocatellia bacterium]|nr:MAG: alkylhydroperoxidase [Blastocatellia bacterium]